MKKDTLHFLYASAIKVASSGAAVILFPMVAMAVSEDFSSKLATIVSLSTLAAVIMRAGLDQYIARSAVYYGVFSKKVFVLLCILSLWASLCFFAVVVFFSEFQNIALMMLSLLASGIIAALCTGAGLGTLSVLCSGTIPIASYYFSIFVMFFLESTDYSYFILFSSISIMCLSALAVFALGVRERKRVFEPAYNDNRDVIYFSLITISRVLRNEAPTIISSVLFPRWVWFIAFSQRLINIFPSIQSVVNVLYFKKTFSSMKVTKVAVWKEIIAAWLIVYIGSLLAYYLYSGKPMLSIVQVISTLLSGFFSGYILRYGSLGITMIATGRISKFFWSLMASILVSFLLSLLSFIILDKDAYVFIVPFFSLTLMAVYIFWGKYVN